MSEWWERLHLLDNPFEKTKGMSPTDLNDLLVKTDTISKYERRLQNPISLFNRIFLIYGEFGSGKSTLFQFIRSRLFGTDTYCRIIRLNGTYVNSSELENFFRMELFRCLTGKSRPNIQDYEIKQEFLCQMKAHDTKGFFLILDELHKNPNYNISLEFLKNLQGSFEEFTEEINLGLMIAGRDEWRTRIEESGEYSGTFDVTDEMSSLTPQDAYQIVLRRLEKYAEHPQKARDLISKDAVEKILTLLRKKTPRHLIKKVRESFEGLSEEQNNLDVTGIEKGIHPNTLTAIKNRLHQVSRVHRLLLRLDETFENPVEYERCLVVICNFFHRDPLEEPLTAESLRKVGVENDELILRLISMEILAQIRTKVRSRSKYGTTIKEKVTITLSPPFRNIFDSIAARFKVAPEDYLFRLYGLKKPPKKKKKTVRKKREKEEFINKMEHIMELLRYSFNLSKGANHMQQCIESYETVKNYVKSPTTHLKPMNVLSIALSSLYNALFAKLIYQTKNNDESREEKDLFESAIKEYSDELSEFYIAYQTLREEGTPISHEDLDEAELIDLYMTSLMDVISRFQEDINLDPYFEIDHPALTDSDQECLRKVRRLYHERMIQEVANDLISYFELKMRRFIKNTLERVHGNQWLKRGLPRDVYTKIQDKIAKEREDPEYRPAENALDWTDFMDLSKIIIRKDNWSSIFEYYFGSENKDAFNVKWTEINDLARAPMAHFRVESTRVKNQIMQTIQNVRWILMRINKKPTDRN